MLTADQIAALGDAAEKIISPISDYLIKDIALRVSEAGQLTSTASYQIWQLQKLGVSQSQIKKRLKKFLGVTEKELKQLLTQAAEVGYNFDLENLPHTHAVPFKKNSALQNIVKAAVEMAQDDLSNMVQTIGFVNQDGVCRPLTEAYQQASDFAFQKVATGAQDYTSAVRDATKELLKKGIRTIDYESGVHTSIEAAVRRNVLGGLGLMQEKISQYTHDELGCDGWEISAHGASAPDHEPIQGKQYSDKEYEKLNNSLLRRIGTLNCGHSAHPIILGVNSPQYSPEELEKMRQENEKGIDYEGKHYTMYEATQRQRKLERAIRSQKRRILVDEATGDEKQLPIDQTKLVRLQDEYARFTKAAGLRSQAERANILDFGPKRIKAAEGKTEERFKEILEKAQNGDKIVLDEDMEIIIAEKPFAEIQDLRGKLSDRAARKWYLVQDAEIPFQIDVSLSREDQARQACDLRNQNRTNARELMRDQKKRRELDLTDPNKSFEELIMDKMNRKKLTREQAIEDILRTATKTRKSVNKQLGLG